MGFLLDVILQVYAKVDLKFNYVSYRSCIILYAQEPQTELQISSEPSVPQNVTQQSVTAETARTTCPVLTSSHSADGLCNIS